MNNKKQSDAEKLESIESFDLDNYEDGAQIIEALFDRKEQIRSLVREPLVSNERTVHANPENKSKK